MIDDLSYTGQAQRRGFTPEASARGCAAAAAKRAEERYHGTLAMYVTERCRCESCRAAAAAKARFYRARRRGMSLPRTWRMG